MLQLLLNADETGTNGINGHDAVLTSTKHTLAANGLRYTNMHTTALCSPSRGCILTGRNHHSIGLATITETSTGYPGYNGILPFDKVQAEVGFDLMYSGSPADSYPFYGHAKVGTPEGSLFQGSPALAVGGYNFGVKDGVTDQNITYALAAKHLKAAAGLQPDNMELRYTLAQSYMWSEQYPEALAEFRYLLAKDPNSAPVHILLGQALDAANQVAAATAEFEAAAKASPRQPEVHFGLGYMYWKQQRYQEASLEFEAELTSLTSAKPEAKKAVPPLTELVKKGIPESDIESVGMGSEKPLVKPDDTPAKRARNRRYEIQVAL